MIDELSDVACCYLIRIYAIFAKTYTAVNYDDFDNNGTRN